MSTLAIFLTIWGAFSHMVCGAETAGAAGHPAVQFFQGSCDQAFDYARQVGGSWFYDVAQPTVYVCHNGCVAS
jgi:hypothetical protein